MIYRYLFLSNLEIARYKALKSTKKHDLGKIYCCSVILGNTFQKYKITVNLSVQNPVKRTWVKNNEASQKNKKTNLETRQICSKTTTIIQLFSGLQN